MVNDQSKKLAELCRKFKIDILYVFGSRSAEVKAWFDGQVDKLEDNLVDVDIGVKPARNTPFSVESKVQLALELEELMGVKRVDLVSFHDADPFLAANIIRGERLFADDYYLADEYDLYILRRVGDLAHFERERMALILDEEG